MSPEEEFKKWWKENRPDEIILPGDKELWLAAYRLGLTRAAEICRLVENNENTVIGKMECEQAILTERDKP